jgi:phage tail-like protein
MTTYGNGLYGGIVYGGVNSSLVQLKVEYFSAKPYAHNAIRLEWASPSATLWSQLIIVRNSLGIPTTPDDGDLIFSLTSPTTNYFIDDSTLLGSGKFYYYSIFLLDNLSVWRNSGSAVGLSTKDYGSSEKMYEYLPSPYKTSSGAPLDVEGDNSDLKAFLKTFGFTYDQFKTYVDNATNRYDTSNLHGFLVPNLLNQMGFAYENELGIQQGRRLIKYSSSIYRKKGTTAGIKTFVSAFTGFNCSIPAFKNMLLTTDAGSFEAGIDGWRAASGASISSISGSTETPSVTAHSGAKMLKAQRTAGTQGSIEFTCGTSVKKVFINAQTPIQASGSSVTLKTSTNHGFSVGDIIEIAGLVPSGYNGSYTVSSINGPDQFTYTNATTGNITTGGMISRDLFDAKTIGVPVVPNTSYIFSIYSRAKTNARLVSLLVYWYDERGRLISSGSPGNTNNDPNSWTRLSSASVTAPAYAAYAVPSVTVNSANAGEVHYFDSAQFEVDISGITSYVSPRIIDIYLEPNRTNEILNPSFEVNVSDWGVTNLSLTRVSGGAITGSSWFGRAQASSASSTLTQSTSVLVTPGVENTLSAYLKTSNTAGVTLTIEWLTSSNTSISTVTKIISSIASTWTRYDFSAIAPSNAAKANVSFVFAGAASDEYDIDAVMFERSSYLNPYFDGYTGYLLMDDVRWDGGTVGKRSMYYRNRASSVIRLKAVIEDYLPIWSTYAVYVANSLT